MAEASPQRILISKILFAILREYFVSVTIALHKSNMQPQVHE